MSVQPPNNLPLERTQFVGREREVEELKHLMGTTRLLTLTGAGGCGKTRLAIHVAADTAKDYADGTWFVEFAASPNPRMSQAPQLPPSACGKYRTAG